MIFSRKNKNLSSKDKMYRYSLFSTCDWIWNISSHVGQFLFFHFKLFYRVRKYNWGGNFASNLSLHCGFQLFRQKSHKHKRKMYLSIHIIYQFQQAQLVFCYQCFHKWYFFAKIELILGQCLLKAWSLLSAWIAKMWSIINSYYSLRKENHHSFPNFFLNIAKKKLFFYFPLVSEQNFLKTKIINN